MAFNNTNTTSADLPHKPTVGEKISGTVNFLIGKATNTNNPIKVAEGEAEKTGEPLHGGHAGASEAIHGNKHASGLTESNIHGSGLTGNNHNSNSGVLGGNHNSHTGTGLTGSDPTNHTSGGILSGNHNSDTPFGGLTGNAHSGTVLTGNKHSSHSGILGGNNHSSNSGIPGGNNHNLNSGILGGTSNSHPGPGDPRRPSTLPLPHKSSRYITPPTHQAARPFEPYKAQKVFRKNRFHYSTLQDDDLCGPSQVAAVSHAIRMARRIGQSERGLRAAALILDPPQADAVVAADLPARHETDKWTLEDYQSETVDLVRTWYREDRTTIFVDEIQPFEPGLEAPSACIQTNQSATSKLEIVVNEKLVSSAGKALMQFSVRSAHYTAAVFHLGVAIFHEFLHGIRIHLVSPYERTPPKLHSSQLHLTKAGSREDGESVWNGESGWFGEELTIGGFLGRKMLDKSPDFADQIEHLGLSLAGAESPGFLLSAEHLDLLLDEANDLDLLLPLLPEQEADWLETGVRDLALRGPTTSAKPRLAERTLDITSTSCGYSGTTGLPRGSRGTGCLALKDGGAPGKRSAGGAGQVQEKEEHAEEDQPDDDQAMNEQEPSQSKSTIKAGGAKASAGKAGKQRGGKPVAGKKEEGKAEEDAEASDVELEDKEKAEVGHQSDDGEDSLLVSHTAVKAPARAKRRARTLPPRRVHVPRIWSSSLPIKMMPRMSWRSRPARGKDSAPEEDDDEDEDGQADGEEEEEPTKRRKPASPANGKKRVAKAAPDSRTPSDNSTSPKPSPVDKSTPAIRSVIFEAFITPTYLKSINFKSVASSFDNDPDSTKLSRHWRDVLFKDLATHFAGKPAKKATKAGRLEGGGQGEQHGGGEVAEAL
ncbi:uncharacterized protein MKK02DRAFT_27968 [Dioszegia hungarica]|uniref:Uncharacterized protein n=1 Tax=Dioszegia hungarica TaxID=4972 RepID=A0AA38H5D9_9TREE|nr:uncharacterized protein MKK02DRAFT_27968 [Dioszegia hungarica]KAI9634832.1 hypothetical protein MKK02DRAFT_27968 [Dioszegia hungarica]